MKKVLVFLLALVFGLCLCACGVTQPTEPEAYTFPEGTTVLGVDVTGLTKEEGFAKLEAAAAAYQLALTVDGVPVSISAGDVDLRCSQDHFMAGADAIEYGEAADFSGMLSFNEGKLRQIMNLNFNKDVTEAAITYDETAQQYVLVPHADGQKSNPNALAAEAAAAITAMESSLELTGVSEILEPVRSAEDPQVQEALALANRMIGTAPAYTYNGSEAQAIPAETVRSFVKLGEDGLTPIINDETLDAYVKEMGETYSVAGTSGPFKTTNGGTVNLTVSYNGLYVDNDGLKQDIITCLREGISETRTAPYQPSGNRDMAYGGTYVEVDLSAQRLWFYKNGERLLSTSLVSGKVASNWCTPTGVYSIYSKSAGAYLTGADYRTYVNYWMPFHYGYGLHDATWRGSFGGEIYLYSGSHGCVNLPLSAAATIFNNASVGTKVILYGGKRSVPPITQSLSGTTSYDVADDVGSFQLNIKPKYSGCELSYKSSNTKVATVDASGKVTVKGIGNAKITVTAKEFDYYTSAEITVAVNVHSACEEGRHVMGQPVVIKEPTCQPGLSKTTCTKCGHSTEQEVKAKDKHTYGEWVVTKEPTCSTEGARERTCTVCGIDKKTGTIAATGKHTAGDWITATAPTCVDEGVKVKKCTVCDTEVSRESIPATGEHTPGEWKKVTAATCTEDGVKAKYCTHCQLELETAPIKAGHKAGDWQTEKAPTCTEPGSRVKKCTVCGQELEREELPKASHQYDGGPSCKSCGKENPDYIPPTEPPTEPSSEPGDEEENSEG